MTRPVEYPVTPDRVLEDFFGGTYIGIKILPGLDVTTPEGWERCADSGSAERGDYMAWFYRPRDT